MKKMFAIFCLSIYLISTTEFSQLLKFPLLIEHFGEHKAKDPNMTFVGFLVLHYNDHLNGHPLDDDYEQDKNLPFIMHTTPLSLVCVPPQSVSFLVKTNIYKGDKSKFPLENDLFIDSILLSSIWQPPKFC